MRKKKWKKPLLWVLSGVFAFVVIGYFGVNMTISYVLKSMVPQVPVVISDLADEENSLRGTITGNSANENVKDTANSNSLPDTQETTEKREDHAATTVSPKDASHTAVESPNIEIQDTQSNEKDPKAVNDELGYQAQITTEKAKVVEDSISVKEKVAVTSVLLKKLSSSELQLLAKLAGGGLTVEEKKSAKEIILNKLSEDEYNQLIQIAAKYGLSQGKNYQDSQKESHK
ncbi:hypothetical protein [Bacillus sp. 3255]|uniref:hypothetical protein n=1 Tax=Bacillus sp. 3255 TaxID=2817904 RepID=UPI00285AEB3C|nr:hypothetical protein [Bacillus sp. 3255]MDR6878337.1 hypothetical protein [Bacillus sp. 3255]